MSGFVGVVNTDRAPVDGPRLRQMTAYMAFRGPDARHVWQDGHVGFGHALLRSTHESAHERQPCSLDGGVWITADARLDGRPDLLHGLHSSGREVAEQAPDVEMILHAYHAWGESCLEHLQGDFAFAIWDARRQRLFCARDRFGVAQFYYSRPGALLLFGNTLNCLRLHPSVSDALNEEAMADFLLSDLNTNPATTTFVDIRRLPPAHSLAWSQGEPQIRRYWALPEPNEHVHYRRAEEYVERFRTLFERAVGDRLRTERVGLHLSGGMDSTSIAATAHGLLRARGRPFDVRAYTIVYERLIPDDEGRYAAQVAAQLGVPIEYLAAEEYVEREAPDPPEYIPPEPTFPLQLAAVYEITRRVAGFSRVLLMGFGGDPLFAVERSAWREALRWGHWDYTLAALWRRLRTCLKRRRRSVPLTVTLPDWIDPGFAARTELRARWEQYLTHIHTRRGRQGMATAPLWSAIFTWSDPGFNGLPVRALFPFFDLRIVQYLQQVPPAPWLPRKRILREAMRDRIPAAVLRRPKTPLRANPHYALMRARGMPPWVEKLLEAQDLEGLVDVRRFLAPLRSPASLSPGLSMQFWRVVSLAYWLRHRQRPATATRTWEGVLPAPSFP
jgi:asparagine synthase (glutamine-hydrolysing)